MSLSEPLDLFPSQVMCRRRRASDGRRLLASSVAPSPGPPSVAAPPSRTLRRRFQQVTQTEPCYQRLCHNFSHPVFFSSTLVFLFLLLTLRHHLYLLLSFKLVVTLSSSSHYSFTTFLFHITFPLVVFVTLLQCLSFRLKVEVERRRGDSHLPVYSLFSPLSPHQCIYMSSCCVDCSFPSRRRTDRGARFCRVW